MWGLIALPALASATAAAQTSLGTWEPKDYVGLISAVTAIVAIVVGYLLNSRTLKASLANTQMAIWQKANETEISEIQRQLDEFYGPFLRISEANRLLNRDLRDRQPDKEHFLLIEKLFDQKWREERPPGEQAMIAEIAGNAKTLREFIASNAKMVNLNVQPYLSRVSAHFRMIELAYEGKLGTDPTLFVRRYVFPRAIDDVIALEVARLERRKSTLRAQPGKPAPTSEDLIIPEKLKLPEWINPPRQPRPELTVQDPSGAPPAQLD